MKRSGELSERAQNIVRHVFRYQCSTVPVIGRRFMPELTLSAARNAVQQLCIEGLLCKWKLSGRTSYVTLDSAGYVACGVQCRPASRFSDQTVPDLLAVLYFCMRHGVDRLTPAELHAIEPAFDTPAGWAHPYFRHQVGHGLALSCCLIDHRSARRRLVSRARRMLADRYRNPEFRSLIHARRFSITILTGYAGAAAAIKEEVARRHRGLAPIYVQVVPELAALLPSPR